MIDEDATFEMFGYRSTDLKKKSNKKVVAICEGKDCQDPVRVIQKSQYRDLCNTCATHTKEFRKASAEAAKKVWEDPDMRAKHVKALLMAQNRPEVKAKIVEARNRPEYKTKQREASLISQSRPEVKAKISEASKEMWEEMTPKECEEFAVLQSCIKQGIPVEDFDGFIGNDQPHLKSISQCIQINKRFKGSDAHHITPSIVIFIPTELYRHIPHNLKTGYNMGEMNMLALQFINGGL